METVTDLLTKFFGPGDYENTPLGTNPFMFESIQGYLAGKLDTIEYPNPGLSDPEYVTVDRGILVKAFGLASLFASVLVVVIRLLTRSFLSAGGPVRRASDEEVKRKWWKFWPWWLGRLRFGSIGWDDWAMIPTLILLGGYTAVNVLGVTHGGMGKHVYDATLKQVRFLLKTVYVHTIIYLTLSLSIKTSILLFYSRLASPINTTMQYIIRALFICVIIYTIVGIFILSFVCKPVHAFWTLELRAKDGLCPDQAPLERTYKAILGFHVVGDFIVLMLPIKMVWSLRLPKKQKYLLAGLFGAGGLACVASIMRLVYFPRINTSLDVTWNVVEIALWGQVEATTAVITASLPALKPLFSSKTREKLSSDMGSSMGGSGPSRDGRGSKARGRVVDPLETVDVEFGLVTQHGRAPAETEKIASGYDGYRHAEGFASAPVEFVEKNPGDQPSGVYGASTCSPPSNITPRWSLPDSTPPRPYVYHPPSIIARHHLHPSESSDTHLSAFTQRARSPRSTSSSPVPSQKAPSQFSIERKPVPAPRPPIMITTTNQDTDHQTSAPYNPPSPVSSISSSELNLPIQHPPPPQPPPPPPSAPRLPLPSRI